MKIATKKPTVKVAVKAPVKAVVKAPVKTASKAASQHAKPVAKPVGKSVVKPAVTKTVAKVTAKPAKAEVAAASKVKVKPVAKSPDVKIKAPAIPTKSSKKATPEVAPTKPKADSKPKVAPVQSTSPMPITTKSAATEASNIAQASPAATKARTSRLAQLTVPSMAQTVASTAAKSSYGPASVQVLVAPPQFVAKQNPKLANNWKTKTAEELTDEEVLAMPNTEYMNIKQMMFFRLKLIQLKKGILESAGATTEHLRDESAVVPDPTDRATIEEEHALELRTRDRERKLLKKIEQSISRIDAGDYGYCDETGEAIGVGRLLARPTATLSLEAQQRRELKQKMFGD
jgi:DnaK suppressor protein